ncbi:hypothetical protein LTR09_005909 [Extremus antarcticus]|uniref:Uncharacterized protein n=1 Tax=Extremus antarcticus TaxID=702011 RepID=A0AAJ0DLP2_9PEZI|nr:hypothetical protein LTR09_005909 [Extremus antarcticus]
MESIIRKLEYGPKARVDDRNPGIPLARVTEFVADLIKPSAGSVLAAEYVAQTDTGVDVVEKDLPPLPPGMDLVESVSHLATSSGWLNQEIGRSVSLDRSWQQQQAEAEGSMMPSALEHRSLFAGGMAQAQNELAPADGHYGCIDNNLPIYDATGVCIGSGWHPDQLVFGDPDFRDGRLYMLG